MAEASYGWSFQIDTGICAQCIRSFDTAWPYVLPPFKPT